eukprot:ANDGO_00078.mRNA.1 SART-1 family protein
MDPSAKQHPRGDEPNIRVAHRFDSIVPGSTVELHLADTHVLDVQPDDAIFLENSEIAQAEKRKSQSRKRMADDDHDMENGGDLDQDRDREPAQERNSFAINDPQRKRKRLAEMMRRYENRGAFTVYSLGNDDEVPVPTVPTSSSFSAAKKLASAPSSFAVLPPPSAELKRRPKMALARSTLSTVVDDDRGNVDDRHFVTRSMPGRNGGSTIMGNNRSAESAVRGGGDSEAMQIWKRQEEDHRRIFERRKQLDDESRRVLDPSYAARHSVLNKTETAIREGGHDRGEHIYGSPQQTIVIDTVDEHFRLLESKLQHQSKSQDHRQQVELVEDSVETALDSPAERSHTLEEHRETTAGVLFPRATELEREQLASGERGTASILSYLRETGELQSTAPTTAFGTQGHGNLDSRDDVVLTYHDEFGRPVSLKEAYKIHSRAFHGGKMSRNKQEKRLVQHQKELREKSGSHAEPASMALLESVQKRTQAPFAVIGGARTYGGPNANGGDAPDNKGAHPQRTGASAKGAETGGKSL